jgi:hypothetical protein
MSWKHLDLEALPERTRIPKVSRGVASPRQYGKMLDLDRRTGIKMVLCLDCDGSGYDNDHLICEFCIGWGRVPNGFGENNV